MTPELHQAIVTRCRGVCECGCGKRVPPGEVDHFFGRAKAPEDAQHCWLLHVDCHKAKTDSVPDRRAWLLKFIAFCGRHRFHDAGALAQKKLAADDYLHACQFPRG